MGKFVVVKYILDLVLPEDKNIWDLFVFESQPEFFYQKTPADFAHTSLSYKQPKVRALIHTFKYKRNKSATKICADFVSSNIIEFSKTQNLQSSLLIPIPRSKTRKQEYGFNQCELICEEILKNSKIKNLKLMYRPKILIHIKDFETQTKLSRQIRIKNSQNSFSIKSPEKILNQNIILIDDVWTTGATLRDAERALKEAGAKNIFKFVIAH